MVPLRYTASDNAIKMIDSCGQSYNSNGINDFPRSKDGILNLKMAEELE